MQRPARGHIGLLASFVALVAAAAPAIAVADDHGRIAFDRKTPAAGLEEIYVVDADGRNVRQVTSQAAGQGATELPAWDPRGGDQLFYDGDAAGNVHLFRADLGSRHARQVTSTDGFEFAAALSPDGNLVAFEHEPADFATSGIYLAPRHGDDIDAPRQVTASPFAAAGGFDSNPDFSPDGTRLTFTRVIDSQAPNALSAIFVVNTDGTGLRQLTPFEVNAFFPRWSPDGTRIAFSTNADNFSADLSANVFTIRPDGIGLTQITTDSKNNHSFSPDWSPNASSLVFAHATAGADHVDLDIVDLRTGRTTVLLHGTSGTVNQDPAWDPRG